MRINLNSKSLLLAFGTFSLIATPSAYAEKSAAEVAKELANPNNSLGFMLFNNDYITYDGDLPRSDSQEAYITSFQPSLPYVINEKWKFFARPLVPIIYQQPVFKDGGFENEGSAIGDIAFDLAFGTGFENGVQLIMGVAGSLPTASNDDIGSNQTRLGPEFFIGKKTDWGFYGGLFNHVWNVGGSNDDTTSITAGQYFFTYNLPDAWQIQMTPTWSYNHQADKSSDKLTLPLGIGVAKTVIFGKTPVKFGLQYWDYVASPDTFGPDRQVRFVISPVIPLPW
jgi:hypothetical protein